MILFSFFVLCLGLLLLIKAADTLVDGSSSLALRFKIKPIVIGLTVVAFGTSSPELIVSVISAYQGNTAIALGNIVGSNIFNILVILGLSSLIIPLKLHTNTIWKEIPMSFLATVILAILGLQTLLDKKMFPPLFTTNSIEAGSLTLSNGLVLLSFFIIFLYYTFGIAKTESSDEFPIKRISLKTSLLFILFGLLGLGIGSKLFVDNAITIAHFFQISDKLIGLTLVAAGTSLPELVTSIIAAKKKNNSIAVGNVVGSNIINIFFILGITTLIHPIPLTNHQVFDILFLLATTTILFLSAFLFQKHYISRIEGSIMFGTYICYLFFLFYRG